jgi:TPR repeat protein
MTKWTPEELDSYRARADAGEIGAQIYLGWAYHEGRYVEKNKDLAKEWLERAADQDSKEAGYRLAVVLILQKDRAGIERLRNLSKERYSPAAYELGNCYFGGVLVERDVDAAVQEWSHASDMGHVFARIKLLKYQNMNSRFYEKPLYFIKLVLVSFLMCFIILKDSNDVRILGSRKQKYRAIVFCLTAHNLLLQISSAPS